MAEDIKATESTQEAQTPIIINSKDLAPYRIILDADNRNEAFRRAGYYPLIMPSEGHKKCVIVLSLSVYGGRSNEKVPVIDLTPRKYAAAGSDIIYTGGYQLEAVPKYIMNEVMKHDVESVEFIMLETDLVHTTQEKEVLIEGRPVIEINEEGQEQMPTEASFFIRQMLDYIDETITPKYGKKDIHFIEYYVTEKTSLDLARLILLLRNEFTAGDPEDEIDENEWNDIYIDTHGGPRETQQLLLNLMAVLREEHIHIDGKAIYSVSGVGENMKVVNAGEGFNISDFVSGIHEFINYGRMQSLNRFYPDLDELPEATANLLRTMQDVSDAVQLCDMAWFENLLPELAQKLTEFKNSEEDKGYLGSFKDLIVSGYWPMIQYDTTSHEYRPHNDALTLIQWFRNKGLYQQMLTICESAVTRYVYDHRIIRYDAFIKFIGKKNKFNYELYNWLFNRIITGCKSEYGGTITVKEGPDFERNMIYPATKVINAYFTLDQNAVTLREFLLIHFELKQMRNHSNHGSRQADGGHGKESPMVDLLAKLDRYIELMQTLADWNENPDPSRTEQTQIWVVGVPHQMSYMKQEDIFAVSDARKDLMNYLQDKTVDDLEEDPEKFRNMQADFREFYDVIYQVAHIPELADRVNYVEQCGKDKGVAVMRKLFEDCEDKSLEFMLKDGTNTDPELPFHGVMGKRLYNFQVKDAVWLGEISGKPYHDDGKPRHYSTDTRPAQQ